MHNKIISIAAMTAHTHLPLSASASPAISPKEFKDSMAKLAFSLSIVAARHNDEQLGRTVTSFMPLNAEPPQLVISIDVRSRVIDLIGASKRFSVSFLSVGQESLADLFAGKGNQEDRFTIDHWDVWPSSSPRLINASVAVDCELVGSIDVGDRMLFVGAIVETATTDDLPLLWVEKDYSVPSSKTADR
jgi:flavin reductase (DIM6/NTAB) family NADH-FMN oxidoreductase RutF